MISDIDTNWQMIGFKKYEVVLHLLVNGCIIQESFSNISMHENIALWTWSVVHFNL